jgi:hypothetical protein
MSVVLQRTYRPQIAPAMEGNPADQGSGRDDITRLCETAAGIGFGKAVSQGATEKGCILGGSAFIGISMRDITLSLVPVDQNQVAPNPLDAFGRYTNVWVRTLGRVWVKAGATVTAGMAAFYNSTNGGFTITGGQAANGYIDFSRQPRDGETVVIGTTTITFKNSGATGNQSNLGPTLGDTVRILAQTLNASADIAVDDNTYLAYPPSPGGAGQGSGAYRLMVASKLVGTAGNSFALGAGTSGGTTSGTVLSGGTAAATAIVGATWVSNAMAGDLAIINLGYKAA